MVFINGKKFNIYDLDNMSTIISRIAYNLNTLPNFLYMPEKIKYEDLYNDTKDLEVIDLIKQIKKSGKKNLSLFELLEYLKDKVGSKLNDRIITIWLLSNDIVRNNPDLLKELSNELIKRRYYYSLISVNSLIENLEKERVDIEEDLEYNKNVVIINNKKSLIFKKINTYKSTKFEIEKIQYKLILNIKNIPLLEIFNSIILNEAVPFSTTKNYFKILKEFVPPLDWIDIEEYLIYVYVSKSPKIENTKTDDYRAVEIGVEGEIGEEKMYITYYYLLDKKNIDKKTFIDRIFNIFNRELIVEKTSEENVAGVFYFPDIDGNLNKYVLSDIIMNDEIFSSILYIDESKKTKKEKSTIYVHFSHPRVGDITVNITPQISTYQFEKKMKDIHPFSFSVGSYYIRVKASKVVNREAFDMLKGMIGKLITQYINRFGEIVEEYKQYLSDEDFNKYFIEEKLDYFEDIDISDKKLKEIAPDIFVSEYTKQCRTFRSPIIVNEQRAIEEAKNGRDVMKFPRDIPDDEKAEKFYKDGEDQHYYICEQKKHIYPGLIKNTKSNKDLFPYVPCCFSDSQRKKPKYKHYYKGISSKSTQKIPVSLITTDKLLAHDQFGNLPINIEKFFTLIDSNHMYKRKGVSRNENSFLHVILEALDAEDIRGTNDIDEKDIILIDTRNEMINEKNAILGKQEMYDMSTRDILELMGDQNKYFDPKLFIHILEEIYNCNIFLFSNINDLNGELILPRHTEAYYKYKKETKCIYVYEHMGSKSNNLKYPQCDIITRIRKGMSESEYIFTYKDASSVKKLYNMKRLSYKLNEKIPENIFPLKGKGVEIISQKIDSYGKLRKLNIKFRGKNISIYTDPLQPLHIKEDKGYFVYRTTKKIADDLIIELNVQVIGETTNIILGLLGNVIIKILLSKNEKVSSENKIGTLDIYNKNKKYARYIISYMFWLFSKVLNGQTDIDEEILYNFGNTIIVDEDYKYEEVSQNFDINSTFIKNGFLVVTSEEILKRLLYVLRLESKRNFKNLIEYHKRIVIPDYYVDIIDFDKHKNQIILYGKDNVEKWLNESYITYNLTNTILENNKKPYFFKNTLVGKNIYLAQNTDTLEKATDISTNWIVKGYNTSIYATGINDVELLLYLYTDSKNIKVEKIKGRNVGEIKIIKYNIKNINYYTSLMKIE